jgi:hypothetical protein
MENLDGCNRSDRSAAQGTIKYGSTRDTKHGLCHSIFICRFRSVYFTDRLHSIPNISCRHRHGNRVWQTTCRWAGSANFLGSRRATMPRRARSQWRDARCARPGGDVHDRNALVGGPDRRKIISVRGVIIRADMADRVPSAAVRGTCQTGAVARFDFRHHKSNHLINLTHRLGRALKTRLCDMTPAAEGDSLTSACSTEGMPGRLGHRNLLRTGLPEIAR